MTKSQTLVSFYGSSSGESNHRGVLLKMDGQLVDDNMGTRFKHKVLLFLKQSEQLCVTIGISSTRAEAGFSQS